MRLLLDTHFLIWLVIANNKIRAAERNALSQAGQNLLVSTLSLWELRLKWNGSREGQRGDIIDPATAIGLVETNGMKLVAPEAADYAVTLVPPIEHRDPFDEMLLVHAQQLGARLLTRDGKLRDHPLAYHP